MHEEKDWNTISMLCRRSFTDFFVANKYSDLNNALAVSFIDHSIISAYKIYDFIHA